MKIYIMNHSIKYILGSYLWYAWKNSIHNIKITASKLLLQNFLLSYYCHYNKNLFTSSAIHSSLAFSSTVYVFSSFMIWIYI